MGDGSWFVLLLTLPSAILSSCLDLAPKHTGFALVGRENFAGTCPQELVVSSEEWCLEEFCRIREGAAGATCNANAVQITTTANETRCYMMQLYHCSFGNDCSLEKDENSSIHFISGAECMLRCSDGQCTNYTRCNGVAECNDGSDEMNCPKTEAPAAPCTPEEFQCRRTGLCIPGELRCDGALRCNDGSDEMGCSEYISLRRTDKTMMITAVSVGCVLSLLLIILMLSCGQKLYISHHENRRRLRNLRLGSSAADYVVRLLPGEAPFEDTMPPSYNESLLMPNNPPPEYHNEESDTASTSDKEETESCSFTRDFATSTTTTSPAVGTMSGLEGAIEHMRRCVLHTDTQVPPQSRRTPDTQVPPQSRRTPDGRTTLAGGAALTGAMAGGLVTAAPGPSSTVTKNSCTASPSGSTRSKTAAVEEEESVHMGSEL